MANKQNFTPEEWTKISESVMLAGMAVSAPLCWLLHGKAKSLHSVLKLFKSMLAGF